MKAVSVLAVVFVVLAVASAKPLSEEQHQFLFVRFVEQYAKNYEVTEFFNRFNTFKTNLAMVMDHNTKANASYTLAVNEFGDLSSAEFKAKFLKLQRRRNSFIRSMNHPAPLTARANAPASLDWRSSGAVTPIKNQGQCGSCWAFSATGSMEGANAIATKNLISLSEQQLVDCAGSTGNQGCNGGLMDQAFEWVIQNGGICSEADYPYVGTDQTCKTTCKPQVKLSGYKDVPEGNEDALLTAVGVGPVSIAIEADQMAFQFYSGGVLDATCGTQLDHGVLAVGYGTDTASSKPYWIVKNSWGTGWGEQGYVRLVRGKNECGLANAASYPTV